MKVPGAKLSRNCGSQAVRLPKECRFCAGHALLASDAGVTPLSLPRQRARVGFTFAHHIAHAWIPKRAYGEGAVPFGWELTSIIDTIPSTRQPAP